MKTRTFALGAALWLVAGTPVLAATAEEAFKDVPANCWAGHAVVEMAVKRSLMNVYPDDTFRGNQPFTRAQLADSVASLINELEAYSNATWKEGAPYHWALSDVPASSPDHDKIFAMVNDYHLWRDVPTVDPDHFHPDETVTRQEVAQVVRNLLSTGEAQRAVMPRDVRSPSNPFKDLTPAQWAYKSILADDSRYGVMIGFPDVTFRPDTHLTRYQYAAIGAQTFGILQKLVQNSAATNQALQPLSVESLFQGTRPVYIGGVGIGPSSALTGTPAAGEIRGIEYPGSWFLMEDVQGGMNTATTGGAGTFDFAWGRPQFDGFQLQPYLGVRYMTGDQSVNFAPGVLFYKSWGTFGLDVNADWNVVGHGFTTGATAVSANHSLNLGAALEIVPMPGLAIHVGPTLGLASPTAPFMGGGTVGISF